MWYAYEIVGSSQLLIEHRLPLHPHFCYLLAPRSSRHKKVALFDCRQHELYSLGIALVGLRRGQDRWTNLMYSTDIRSK